MAFGTALNADDEEEKKQQSQNAFTAAPPTLGGSAPGGSLAGGFGGGSAATPSKTQAQGGGSGFVNLGRYFNNATADNAGKVSGGASTALGAEKSAFDAAANPLRQAQANFGTVPTEQDVTNAFTSAGSGTSNAKPGINLSTPQYQRSAFGTKNIFSGTGGADDSQLSTWLNAKYDGPTSVNYDPNVQNFTKIANLAGIDTGFDAAYGQGASGGIGNSMLDQALFRSDPRVAAAQAAAKNNAQSFVTGADKEITDLNAKGAGFADQAQKIRDTTRGALQSIYDQRSSALDARVNAARQADTDAATNFKPDNLGRAYESATDVNRNGLASQNDVYDFSRLNALLGTEALGPVTGNYQAGGIERTPVARKTEAEKEAGRKQKENNDYLRSIGLNPKDVGDLPESNGAGGNAAKGAGGGKVGNRELNAGNKRKGEIVDI